MNIASKINASLDYILILNQMEVEFLEGAPIQILKQEKHRKKKTNPSVPTYIWIIVHGGYQALYQGLQWSRNKVPILINRVHTSLSHIWLHLSTTTGTKHAGKYWRLGHSFLQKQKKKKKRVKLYFRVSYVWVLQRHTLNTITYLTECSLGIRAKFWIQALAHL